MQAEKSCQEKTKHHPCTGLRVPLLVALVLALTVFSVFLSLPYGCVHCCGACCCGPSGTATGVVGTVGSALQVNMVAAAAAAAVVVALAAAAATALIKFHD